MSDMEKGARVVEFRKDAIADLACLIGGALSEEDDDLAEFLIRTLRDDKRFMEVWTKLAFEFFGLNLQTAGADDVVFSSDNPKFRKIRR